MAGNEIRYNVKVDASGANRALTQFGRAAEKAGKDAADALDDTATAGDKARAALVEMSTAMDTELREAAAAAEALRLALGEAGDTFDTNQVVADLNRMGVSFDEIRGDADKFADTLKQVDGVRVQQVNDGLDGTKRALDGVSNSADQSRSVLANMAGNTAQDLGELQGVAGTAGVAIGQLAEYATEGNISLSSLAKVAGPMAGLAAATIIATNAMKFFQQDAKRNAEAVDAMTEAVRRGEDPLEAMNALLIEQGGILTQQRDQGIKETITDVIGLTDSVENVTPALLKAGVTITTWNDALEGGGPARDRFVAGLTQLREEGQITQSEWYSIVNAFGDAAQNYDKALQQGADASAFFVTSQRDLNKILADSADPFTKHTELWDALIRDVADGTFDFENAADAVDMLAEATGKSNEEIVAMVAQKADEHAAALAEQFAAAAQAAGEQAAAIAAAAQAAADYGRIVAGREWGATGIEAATTAYEEYRQLVTGDRQRVTDSEEAWDGLGDAIEAGSGHLMELTSPEGRAVYDALDELGATIVPDLAKAFDDSDGDINTFRRSVDTLAAQTMRRLQDEFGLSEEQARDMIRELGLMPDQVETYYRLAGDAEAKAKLELLQGSIDALPDDVRTTVTQQIILGDYQGALRTVQAYYTRHGATIPVDADISQALEALRRLQAIARFSRVVVSVGAQQTAAGYSAAPTSAAARGVGVAATAAGAAGPVTVNVNAAVVGNRYDVERVVAGAVRNAVRLGGRRHLNGGPR